MLTLVPARGGSKRIPRKNLRLLAGVPLLLWTLIPFRQFDPVVSSDDPEILGLADSHGFRTIRRPEELATDDASSAAVAHHAMAQTGDDTVMLLQPTTPFRSMGTVERSLQVFEALGLPTIAVRGVPHAFKNGKPLHGVEAPTGSCYVIRGLADTFVPDGYQGVTDTSLGALDIDTDDDWRHAEAVAQSLVRDLRRAMVIRAGWAA